jgi:prolyl 4-hydroxylase
LGSGGREVNIKIRDSKTTYFVDLKNKNSDSVNLIDLVYTRVAETIGIDKNQFEEFQITNYEDANQHFNAHYDFLIEMIDNKEYTEAVNKMCVKGGNRIGTVLLYLNDVADGGETYFSWEQVIVKPAQGKMLYFKYDYDDPTTNLKTQHQALPPISNPKWVITILIAEAPLDKPMPNFNKFSEEGKLITNLHDTNYELECGPDYDRRTLSISLPANDDARNTVVVGFTAGMDSSLLLYLLGMLNSHQIIPYIIIPVIIDSFQVLPENENGLGEVYATVPLMVKLIQSKLKNKGGILDFTYGKSKDDPDSDFFHVCPSNIPIKKAFHGMLDYFNNRKSSFRKHKFLCMGYIEPPDADFKGNNAKISTALGIIKAPLFNLQKYHIVDAILQLDLEDILKLTPIGDAHSHTNLTEPCNTACTERRWAFTKLLGLEQMGLDYFVYKNNPDGSNKYEAEILKKLNLDK